MKQKRRGFIGIIVFIAFTTMSVAQGAATWMENALKSDINLYI